MATLRRVLAFFNIGGTAALAALSLTFGGAGPRFSRRRSSPSPEHTTSKLRRLTSACSATVAIAALLVTSLRRARARQELWAIELRRNALCTDPRAKGEDE